MVFIAKKKKTVTLTLFTFIFALITALGAVADICWVYFKVAGMGKEELGTVAVDYVNGVEEDEAYVMEMNVYTNAAGNGVELYEMKFNSYADDTMSAYYGLGMQMVGSNSYKYSDWPATILTTNSYEGFKGSNIYHYNSFDDVSYDATAELNIDRAIYIDIDGTPFMIKPKGNVWFDKVLWINKYYSMDYHWLFAKMIEAVNSMPYGDYTSTYFNLADYVDLYKGDENGKFTKLSASQQLSMFKIKIHKDYNGANYAKQSLFSTIKNNPGYNNTGVDIEDNYWQSQIIYNLTENNFIYRTSTIDQKVYASLKTESIDKLANLNNAVINITFNLDNVECDGFDYLAIAGLKINKLTLISSNERTFEFKQDAVKDTGINMIYKTDNITLVGIDLEEEVVVI